MLVLCEKRRSFGSKGRGSFGWKRETVTPGSFTGGNRRKKNTINHLLNDQGEARGMSLGFVAPKMKEGKPAVQLQQAEISKGNEKWAYAVIFYVIGYKPTITAVHRCIGQIWSC